MNDTEFVLAYIRREVTRSIGKHGPQTDVPMGTGPHTQPFEFDNARVFHNDFANLLAQIGKASTDARSAAGTLTWRDILLEEVLEALAERPGPDLRGELIQVAAVAVKMCEVIDRGARDQRNLCSQCGQPFTDRACGPTHALIAHERQHAFND